MSKTCSVCRRAYPDHLQACPHCAKTREEDSSVIRLHDPGQQDWTDSPSSSSDGRRGDVITIDPVAEAPGGSADDSSIEILPEKAGGKKKTHLAPKGRDTKLVGLPPDEADIGQQPTKPPGRSAPKTMIAGPAKGEARSSEDSSMEINLEEKKKGSSLEMGKEKKAGSSFEISLPGTSESSLVIGREKKVGSSTEFGKEKKSGSSVEINLPSESDSSLEVDKEYKPGSSTEIGREKKTGSSVEIALDKKSGSSVEIRLPKEKHDDSPSSSLLLGGPGSDIGSGEPSSDQMSFEDEAKGDDSSAVDLASPPRRAHLEEDDEEMTSDSAVVAETRTPGPEARGRPAKKAGAGLGQLIGVGAGLLAASLLWIFGPLDGLRGSLRETVGLSQEKKTASGLHQIGISLPAGGNQREAPAPQPAPGKEPEEKKPAPLPAKEPAETKPAVVPAPAPDKEPDEKKPASVPAREPAETKPVVPAPGPIAEKTPTEKGPDLLAQVAPAVKLAKEQKYQEAAALLQKVRGAGTTNDETFLRCCDELLASWKLREKLGTAGARQGDPLSALDSLLKEKKEASSAMTAAMEKIKSADPKAGNLSQGIDALLEAAKKADDQAKAAQAGLKKLEKEKEDTQGALTATTNLLKPGNYLDAQRPNLAQGVEKLLADKKNSDTQVSQANAKLKEAEETIQDMTQKLIDAKQLKPGEKPVRTSRAPSQDADLTLAEKYYSAGVIQYWKGDYPAAEKDFTTAIRYFKDDARFFYYLGLTSWQEGKRAEATEAFQKANELESKSRPSSAQINAMLERVQGTARQAIDQAREHPQAAAEN